MHPFVEDVVFAAFQAPTNLKKRDNLLCIANIKAFDRNALQVKWLLMSHAKFTVYQDSIAS